jgi:hypothetical protein
LDETKIIVTHRGALKAKYGAGLSKVLKAVDRLVAADAKRGIVSRLVALDSARDMRDFGAAPMGNPQDREGAKRAVDAIDATLKAHYYLILGAWDVVPMQNLDNPAGSLYMWPFGDPDEQVPTDLPYACDTGFTSQTDLFQGPTRVVGRLPDIPGARNPAYLVKLLKWAAGAKSLPRKAYERGLGLTAAVCERSSAKTMKSVFGQNVRLLVAPPQDDRWSRAKLRPRAHFINCHGDPKVPAFRGELDAETEERVLARDPKTPAEVIKPIAITSASLKGNVTPGTVVASECCYALELYDPGRAAPADRGQYSMALTYLESGASGFFGSTTLAYGMQDKNRWADIMCRHFLKHVLSGASLGRAALMARHDYIGRSGLQEPVQLKTLAQYCLLGDPSIHPVARPRRRADVRPKVDQQRIDRERRRRNREILRQTGAGIAAVSRRLRLEASIPDDLLNAMVEAARTVGLDGKLARLVTLEADSLAVAAGERDPRARVNALQVLGLVGKIKPGEFGDRYVAIMIDAVDGKPGKPVIGYGR